MITKEQLDKYDMTIGIECHVQLNTKTKLFSGADNDARDKAPNMVISPIDYALPGMLPVLNKEAVTKAVLAGHALKSEINLVSRFDRKHYYYPDLPKAYQISQLYQPIIGAGQVIVVDSTTGDEEIIRIEHAHLEEDAGKLTHRGDYSLVDLNRCGTPLIEIVSMPDIHSAATARAYVTELHRLMTFAGVTNGDLYQGNMRFDVNISIAKKGAKELGVRSEIKNLNSFRSVEKTAEYEFKRQVELLEAGKSVKQETRGWSEPKQKTMPQRSKEEANDYRYMPDPDIPPVVLTDEFVKKLYKVLPTMPGEYRAKWTPLKLNASVTETLLNNHILAQKLTAVLDQAGAKAAKMVANWFMLLNSDDFSHLNPELLAETHLIELTEMVDANELNSTAAKEVFAELFDQNKSPRTLAKEMNLLQVSSELAIVEIVDQVLALPESAQAVADIKAGQDKAIGFLVGLVMRHSQGKANPGLAQKLIKERIK